MMYTVILAREGHELDDIFIESADAVNAEESVCLVREKAFAADYDDDATEYQSVLAEAYPLVAVFAGDLTPELTGRDMA